MQETKTHDWKGFFRLILKAKLPWHIYILALIGLFASTTLTLGLPVVMSEIFAGNIFDFEIVSKYFTLMIRSEEHTSELQSRFDLVCRLLLEKKKNNII